MFNVGVIGSNSIRPLVKLTSRFIGYVQYPQVIFRDDGQEEVSGIGVVSGEWYVPGATAGIGNSYQIRYTLQAGDAPLSYPNDTVETSWTDITNNSYRGRRIVWGLSVSGRVLIEIRHKATQEIKAAAQFWSNASSAP